MSGLEWVQLLLRWFHVFAAIIWIGQNWLYIWMERHMKADELWMVHGGGFFRLNKLTVPKQMPESLLWFKWESALTWLSGMLLLVVHYYAVEGLLVDPHGPVGHGWAIVIAVGVLAAGWIGYRAVWSSPLGRHELVGAAVSLVLVMVAAWGLRQVLSSRAAFVQIGAMFGTIMVANVWMIILPGQRRVIAARMAGQEPDLNQLARGRRASRHNSYMSIPVVFLMLAPWHFLSVIGHQFAWAFIGGLTLVGFIAARILRGPSHEPR